MYCSREILACFYLCCPNLGSFSAVFGRQRVLEPVNTRSRVRSQGILLLLKCLKWSWRSGMEALNHHGLSWPRLVATKSAEVIWANDRVVETLTDNPLVFKWESVSFLSFFWELVSLSRTKEAGNFLRSTLYCLVSSESDCARAFPWFWHLPLS